MQAVPINIYEKASLSHFFMPGFIHNLLINKSVPVEENYTKNTRKNIKNEDIDKELQNENLSVLLGYDARS